MYGFLFFLGLFFGSFFNVVADRLSNNKSLLGRSQCDACKHSLTWKDLIPIVSYIQLGGKCRYCKESFSIQYPLVEIATGILFSLGWYLGNKLHFDFIEQLFYMSLLSCLFIFFLSDIRYRILPDSIQIVTFMLITSEHFYAIARGQSYFSDLGGYLLSGVVTLFPILTIHAATRGKGMGFGDVKLAFHFGYLVGWIYGLLAIYIAFLFGGVVGSIVLLLKKGNLKSKIPFGPFLIAGLVIMIYFQESIQYVVLKYYGILIP